MERIKDAVSGAQSKEPENDIWHVYMVRCSDGTLYTGITNNLEKRIEAHNSDKDGARYTRSRRPVKLVYAEQAGSRSAAAKLEYRLKKLPRSKKKEFWEDRGQGVGEERVNDSELCNQP
jgi:putative endonuclease